MFIIIVIFHDFVHPFLLFILFTQIGLIELNSGNMISHISHSIIRSTSGPLLFFIKFSKDVPFIRIRLLDELIDLIFD